MMGVWGVRGGGVMPRPLTAPLPYQHQRQLTAMPSADAANSGAPDRRQHATRPQARGSARTTATTHQAVPHVSGSAHNLDSCALWLKFRCQLQTIVVTCRRRRRPAVGVGVGIVFVVIVVIVLFVVLVVRAALVVVGVVGVVAAAAVVVGRWCCWLLLWSWSPS